MTHSTAPTNDLRSRIVGIDRKIPLLDGSLVTYVNLDNAASTPALTDVMDAVAQFTPYYSSVHRGTGFKSRLSTAAYDRAHEIVAEFVGANRETNAVIFGKNTTEAINKLSYRLPAKPGAVVITTQMEHHSNDLPWRARFRRGPCASRARWPLRRGRLRPAAAAARRQHRAGDRHRRIQRQRLLTAHLPASAQRPTPPARTSWWTARSWLPTARLT